MTEIHLSQEQQAVLDHLAASSGKAPAKVLDEALRAYAGSQVERAAWMQLQEPGFSQVWDNEDDAVYDQL